MPTVTIHGIDASLEGWIRERAARNHRSMESELCLILSSARSTESRRASGSGEVIRDRFPHLRIVESAPLGKSESLTRPAPTGTPLFDAAYVPTEEKPPISAMEANKIVEGLRSHLVEQVVYRDAEFPSSVLSNMVRVYSQSHLRRCLQLIEAAHQLTGVGYGLAALIMVRCLYEAVANYLCFSADLIKMIKIDAELSEIWDFILKRMFSARAEDLIESFPMDNVDVKAVNVLTQIQKVNKIWPGFASDYEYLSEHTHPNALGAVCYFVEAGKSGSQYDDAELFSNDVFADEGRSPVEDRCWVLRGAEILRGFAFAMEKLHGVLPALTAR